MIFQLIVGAVLVGIGWTSRATNQFSPLLFVEGLILINLALGRKRKSLNHL